MKRSKYLVVKTRANINCDFPEIPAQLRVFHILRNSQNFAKKTFFIKFSFFFVLENFEVKPKLQQGVTNRLRVGRDSFLNLKKKIHFIVIVEALVSPAVGNNRKIV